MTRIIRQYDSFLLSRSPAAQAVLALEKLAGRCGWRFVLFGGSARDIYLHGENAVPRDLDIVVDNVTQEDLQAELQFPERTHFGGLKGKIGSLSVDIWPLDTTWAFKRMNLGRKPSFDDLVLTTPFNLEGIAIEPAITTVLYDGGFQKCIETKTLEISYAPNADAFVALTLVRAAMFAKKLDLRFGPQLTAYIHKNYAKTEKRLDSAQRGYYGKRMMPTEEIRAILNPASAA